MHRPDGRAPGDLRPVEITPGFQKFAEGSALIKTGDTWVLCAATVEDGVPPFVTIPGAGWVTAEYAMLPRSTLTRSARGGGGRAKEISRLIGRALRAAVNLKAMEGLMVRVDCDVIEADGGTRTAAVTGAWIAMHQALADAVERGLLSSNPIVDEVAAVSVGLVGGEMILDLDYEQDVAADVDMNVVMTGRGLLVEVQGTAERSPFSRKDLDGLLDLATVGIEELHDMQRRAVAG